MSCAEQLAPNRYFFQVSRRILTGGERFVTVLDEYGAPAYYATAFLIWRRDRGVSAETLASDAAALVHLGQAFTYLDINVNERLEAGEYFDDGEIETIAQLCGVSTKALRRLTESNITEIRSGASIKKTDLVSNELKNRRLDVLFMYSEVVGKVAERSLPPRSPERAERASLREQMKNDIKGGKSLMRSSRVRGVIEHGELARVAAFVINGDAADIWPNDALASRNWAITKLLIECGLRQSELRQLKVDDIDTGLAIVTVERRHNDPDDPRLYEPNAKTFDRKIPMSDGLCDALEDYLMGAGGEVADHSGSPFFFLSHSPRNLGEPISAKTVARAIKDLGEHLSVPDLTPHHLRHSWIQNLADWAIENGVGAAEFERFANHMGGWSYLSKMASEYRGDQITQKAYDAGLQVMEARS